MKKKIFNMPKIRRWLYIIGKWLVDLLYPNLCPFCGESIPFDEYFCKNCSNKFSLPPENDELWEYVDGFAAATAYDKVSIPFVGKMKRKNDGYALAGAAFKLYKNLCSAELLEGVDFITYVPMRRKDIGKRGYNQAKIIALELSGLSGIRCSGLLKKIKATKEQKRLGEEERRVNVKGAFALKGKKNLIGKTVLVVDDVCTTGSTLSEAARVIKEAGAIKVVAGAFAKTKGYAKNSSK